MLNSARYASPPPFPHGWPTRYRMLKMPSKAPVIGERTPEELLLERGFSKNFG